MSAQVTPGRVSLAAEQASLELRGRVRFADVAADGPTLQGIDRFDLDERGRIGMLRWTLEGEWVFERIDPSHAGTGSIAIPSPDPDGGTESGNLALVWIADSHWLLVQGSVRGPSSAAWIDVEAGAHAPRVLAVRVGARRRALRGWLDDGAGLRL